MAPNILVIALTALIPFAIAFIWFHPKTFGGDAWTKMAGLSEEKGKTKVSPLKLALSVFFNFLVSMALFGATIHQSAVVQMLGGDNSLLSDPVVADFMAKYGATHLTFGHGVIHGIIFAIMVVLPLYGYVMIFEHKSAKYLFVNLGFWLISLALVGGVIAQWGTKMM